MKNFYVLFILITAAVASAQNFTNGSVYNHQVGDTIVEEYYETLLSTSNGPPRTTRRIFTGKVIAPTLDTIFYTEHRTINQLQGSGMNWTMGFTNTAVSYFVTNLQSSVINYTFSYLPSCQFQRDTSFIDSCGLNVHEKELFTQANPQGCFEPHYFKDKYIEKVGLYQVIACGNCLPRGLVSTNRLLYASVNSCGQAVSIVTGLEKYNMGGSQFVLYPNPSSGVYYFNSPGYGVLNVLNAIGKQVSSTTLSPGTNKLDISDEPEGVYFLSLQLEGRSSTMKIIKQ